MACFLLQSGDSTDDLDRQTNRPVICLIQIFRGHFSETLFLHNYAKTGSLSNPNQSSDFHSYLVLLSAGLYSALSKM
ncbi:unknown [Prevotella sp. CAG:487]|nr:unknown [Prevotella sp. CAG:487]